MSKRVFVFVTYMVDDNNNPITETVPLLGTESSKVAETILLAAFPHKSTKTLLFEQQVKRILPGVLPDEEKFGKGVEEILNGSESESSLIEDILKG